MQAPRKSDVQAIGQEGDEDVRLDAGLELVKDPPDRQVAFEVFEGLRDRDQQQIMAPLLAGFSSTRSMRKRRDRVAAAYCDRANS
jgi:hypothetical protein